MSDGSDSDPGGPNEFFDSTAIVESVVIDFELTNLPPKQKFYSFINGKPISSYTKPTGGNFGVAIETDSFGDATGQIVIPSDTVLNFPTGSLELQFGDSNTNFAYSKSFATATFRVSDNLGVLRGEQFLSVSADATRTDTLSLGRSIIGSQIPVDPLFQTFYVDAAAYPFGIFVTSLDLYFYTKSNTFPVSIELRSVQNGRPSTGSAISGSYVRKLPNSVLVPTTPSLGIDSTKNTTFTFKHPIYLKQGQEYAICIMTDTSEYSLFSGTFGTTKYGDTNKVTRISGVGNLFPYNNIGTPNKNTDICFVLNRAKFDTGSVNFELSSKTESITQYFDVLKLRAPRFEIADKNAISFQVKTKEGASFVNYRDLQTDYEIFFNAQKTASAAGDIKLKTFFTNQSPDVSPVIDLESLNTLVYKRVLGSTSSTALSTYYSKTITVDDQQEFTGLSLETLINKPAGTSIKVYCKLLGVGDSNIDLNSWIELPRKIDPNLVETTDKFSYVQDFYQKLSGLSYTSLGITYTSFKAFKIKIEFFSSSTTVAPYISKYIARTV